MRGRKTRGMFGWVHGGKGNPAWDFVYFQRDYAVNREFSFHARAVYRKFTSAADLARLYEAWSGGSVILP
jgi:hypothetical protein